MCASLPCCLCLLRPALLVHTKHRSDSVFENPTTRAKLTIWPAIRLCQRLVQIGQPIHPHCRQDAPDARKKGGSGDQIALKDGIYLLVVQYIWHGPFRPSMCGALKWQQSPQRATGNNGGIDRSPRDRQRSVAQHLPSPRGSLHPPGEGVQTALCVNIGNRFCTLGLRLGAVMLQRRLLLRTASDRIAASPISEWPTIWSEWPGCSQIGGCLRFS